MKGVSVCEAILNPVSTFVSQHDLKLACDTHLYHVVASFIYLTILSNIHKNLNTINIDKAPARFISVRSCILWIDFNVAPWI